MKDKNNKNKNETSIGTQNTTRIKTEWETTHHKQHMKQTMHTYKPKPIKIERGTK